MANKIVFFGLFLILFSGCVLFGSEEKEYLWYGVRLKDKDNSQILDFSGGRSTHFGYIEEGRIYNEGNMPQKYKFNYSLSTPVDVPEIALNPDEFISLAERKVGGVDKSAEFRKFSYLIPQLTEIFFGEERPSAVVFFGGDLKDYLVVYDARTKEEMLFREANLVEHPLCMTTADNIGRNVCTPELTLQDGAIPFSLEIQTVWGQALLWLRDNTEKDSRILSWWDYYASIELFAERDAFPESDDEEHIVVAAKFLYSENEADALAIVREYDMDYVVLDYTMIGKSGAPYFIAGEDVSGRRMGYSQCTFSPQNSQLEPSYVSDGQGGFNRKRTILFTCTVAGELSEYVGAISFDVIDDERLEVNVYPLINRSGQLSLGSPIPWESWRKEHSASILGVQPPMAILSNAIAYGENRGAYINFQTFTTFVYVPGEFNKYMFTSLYLGDYMDEYKQLGLCDPEVKKLNHLRLVDGFSGDPAGFISGGDLSYLGYVKVYEVVS